MTQADGHQARGNAELVRAMHDAFNNRDRDRVMTYFSEDIAWHVPGNNPMSGTIRGREQLWERYIGAMWDRPARIEDQHVLEHGENVVALAEVINDFGTGLRTWKIVEVFRCGPDGRLAERWDFTSGQEGLDALITNTFERRAQRS